MKLFGKIDSIDISEAEEDRIEKRLMDPNSLQFRVLTTKAPAIRDHDFWRRAQKTFHVTGFRDGNPKAIQMVLARALDPKKMQTTREPHASWYYIAPLYERSVRLYLHDDLTNLNTLLTREEFNESLGTLTEQILRCIVKCLPLYEVTVDQVRELYELWGFERTAYVDEILTSVPVEAATVRRMIAESVGTMRRELSSAITTTRIDLLRHVEAQEKNVESIGSLLQKTRHELDQAIAKLDRTVVRLEEAYAANVARSKKLDRPLSNGQDQGNVPIKGTGHKQSDDRTFAAVGALQARVEGIGKQLKDLRESIKPLQSSYSPIAIAKPIKFSATTVLHTINKWNQVFKAVGVAATSLGVSWILLEIVRRSQIILTDKPQLLLALFNALPEGEVRHVVASPLWISEAEWKDELAYISDDSGAPRVLVVSDFDVALQECYLVPALTEWTISAREQSANRVVLVPSDGELGMVNPRVFELASLLTHSAPYILEIKRLGETITHSPPTLEFAQSGASIVGYTLSKNVSYEDHLKQYAANYGVAVPPRVLVNFVNLYEGLRASLNARDAGYIAQHATLIPWCEHARGEAVAHTLEEALKVVLDDG